ncbi:MAG: sugar ABC transporter ATP-binding protein [Deltaproteobacteria bacterium]|nr:sugar ABC transporter ATP-binding protein [Deltaproteobacteria bacterium]
MPESLLKAVNITKNFPGVKALDKVCFELQAGEVHVLFGENGAGKSTLIKIFAGSLIPDKGEILLKGSPVSFRNPYDARKKGISAVYQEFSLINQLSVAENIFLGAEIKKIGILDDKKMLQKAEKILNELNFPLNPKKKVGDLKRAERQMTEIAKAFKNRIKILILDEPTASLTDMEVKRLFEIIKNLSAKGVGIIYISHRINEFKKIGDRITILRNGKNVGALDMAEAKEEKLITLMTGQSVKNIFPKIPFKTNEVILSVKNLSTRDGLKNISFDVRRGEILGVAGLVGSGKSRIGRSIFSLEEICAGEIIFEKKQIKKISPKNCIEKGIIYSPADRHKEGLVLCRSVKENQTLASISLFERRGFINLNKETETVRKVVDKMSIHPPDLDRKIKNLSGGNQQKVVLSRGLNQKIKLFIFDEATCGIDIGAKHEVYLFLKEQILKGAAVIYISSELPEILRLCHTIMVISSGEISSIMQSEDASEEKILTNYFGMEAV